MNLSFLLQESNLHLHRSLLVLRRAGILGWPCAGLVLLVFQIAVLHGKAFGENAVGLDLEQGIYKWLS